MGTKDQASIVAGKHCVSCRKVFSCRKRMDVFRDLFFAIGTDRQIDCDDHAERNYHGIEGVAA